MGDSPASIPFNSSGTEIATAANPLRTDPTGTTTQPVSATALPLPTNAATSGKQDTGNTSLGNIDTKLPASVGQKAMAASLPVVIASDQSAIPVTGSFAASVIPNPDDTTGNISALNGTVSAAVEGWQSCGVVLTGTWAATVVPEVSYDGGTTWISVGLVVPASVANSLPVITGYVSANGSYQIMGMGPMTHVRVRALAYTSGTVAVRLVFSDTAPAMGYSLTQILQNVMASVLNSSTANLAAWASFTGIAESTLGIAGIQVNIKASQPVSIQVQQSQEGTNWDTVDEQTFPAGEGDARTFQAVGSYFRLVVTNVGNATTTYFRLQTALCPVVEAVPRALTPTGRLRLASMTSSWSPDPNDFQDRAQHRALLMDRDRNLRTRGGVFTDAASFRDDFTVGENYTDLTGTVYFTNGSKIVTGVGTAFGAELNKWQYLKLSSHADSVYNHVIDIVNDTQLELEEPYAGATGSGTGRTSFWVYAIGTGGSITQTNSEIALASGTTSGTLVQAKRTGDYLPYVGGARIKISQRIANQETHVGLADGDIGSVNTQALIVFTGTDNTKAKLRTSFSATDVEETEFTLPNALVSSTYAYYQIEIGAGKVTLLVNDVKVAEHRLHIPGPYTPMDCHVCIKNTAVPASTTTLTLDTFYLTNFDQVQVSGAPKGDPLPTKEMRASKATCANVTAAVADTLVLAANADRLGASVVNDSASILYVKFGSGASATSYTVRMTAYAYYEVPFGYTGQINGFWVSAIGNARVTEVQ